MNLGDLAPVLYILSGCGGIAGIIATIGWAKGARFHASSRGSVREDAMLTELKALKAQMQELQSTGHQFDMSFDATLTRLEERMNRLETKSATATANDENRQRLGAR